jgi:hypothetical protein
MRKEQVPDSLQLATLISWIKTAPTSVQKYLSARAAPPAATEQNTYRTAALHAATYTRLPQQSPRVIFRVT